MQLSLRDLPRTEVENLALDLMEHTLRLLAEERAATNDHWAKYQELAQLIIDERGKRNVRAAVSRKADAETVKPTYTRRS